MGEQDLGSSAVVNARVIGFTQLALTNSISKVSWALTLILLLRHLGQVDFGILATLWSMATIAGGFIDLGTSQALMREGSRHPGAARHLAAYSLILQIILTFTTAAGLIAFAYFAVRIGSAHTAQLAVIFLGIATPLIDRFQNVFTVFSQIGSRYATFAGWRSAYFLSLLLTLGCLAADDADIVTISWAYFVLTALFVAAAGRRTWALLPAAAPDHERYSAHDLILNGLPFLGIAVLTLAYGRVEVAVLGAAGRTAAAGAYHIAYQLILVVYSVSGIYFTVVYPRLYRHLRDEVAIVNDFRDTTRWLALLGWAATPPLVLFATPVLQLLGGPELVAYAPVLRILALMILLVPGSAALNFLLPMDRLRERLLCDVIGVAITAAGAVFAAINDQITLAAIMAVMGYAAAAVLAHILFGRQFGGLAATTLKEFVSAGSRACAAAALTAWLPLSWWLVCAAYFGAYACLLMLTGHPVKDRLLQWHATLRHS